MKNKDGSYFFKTFEELENYVKFISCLNGLISLSREKPYLWFIFKENYKEDIDEFLSLLGVRVETYESEE